MELLATVHWVAAHEGTEEVDTVVSSVHAWNARKKKIMSGEHVTLAHHRLTEQGWL
jgi:hypothetical protein